MDIHDYSMGKCGNQAAASLDPSAPSAGFDAATGLSTGAATAGMAVEVPGRVGGGEVVAEMPAWRLSRAEAGGRAWGGPPALRSRQS